MDVCIVGGGLAGLACARELHRAGHSSIVLESEATPGGRVQTDVVDGFRLDRGFQILLTAYPEAQRVLDYGALDLRSFEPGGRIFRDGRFYDVGDPLRRPTTALQTLLAPIGSVSDKLRILLLVARVRRGPAARLLRGPDGSTMQALVDAGFSPRDHSADDRGRRRRRAGERNGRDPEAARSQPSRRYGPNALPG